MTKTSFGFCGTPEQTPVGAKAGYSFFEWHAGQLLAAREDETSFQQALKRLKQAALPCPVVNCFIPADLKISGPVVDKDALKQYASRAFRRAAEAKIEVIVFGSGGARRAPEGFDPKAALEQVRDFCSVIAPMAHEHGITIALEPLNRKECNILNTVGKCAEVVRQVNHPALRLLADSYHWGVDADRAEDIVTNAKLLAHVHVATWPGRRPPGGEPCDLAPFLAALRQGGYTGRISVEADLKKAEETLPRAIKLLRSLQQGGV